MALTYYDNWATWLVAGVAVAALVLSVMTALVVDGEETGFVALGLFGVLLAPPLAVLAVWQASQHMESPRLATLLYLVLLVCLAIAIARGWYAVGLARVHALIAAVSFGLAVWGGVWELLRRLAASIPTTIVGLVVGVVGFCFVAYEWGK